MILLFDTRLLHQYHIHICHYMKLYFELLFATLNDIHSPGLTAFEHEGIQNITMLKEQLVAAGHEQSAAIVKRHGDVILRWQRLLADSAARKQRLLQLQDQFRQIEELYLTFAKKVCIQHHHQQLILSCSLLLLKYEILNISIFIT